MNNTLGKKEGRKKEEDIEALTQDTASAFAAASQNRKAEVRASKLTAEQNPSPSAKTKEIDGWIAYAAVRAASREGLSAAAPMRMRWVTTIRTDGSLETHLVVLVSFTSKFADILE